MGNAESSQPPPQPGSAAKPRSWRDEAQLMGTCSPEELAAVIRGGGEGPRLLCYGDSLTAGYTMLTPYTREYASRAPASAMVSSLMILWRTGDVTDSDGRWTLMLVGASERRGISSSFTLCDQSG